MADNRVVVLTGEYIEPHTIPAHWIPRITRNYYKSIFKKPCVLKTEHGTFLLNPWHLEKKVPLEQFPPKITLAGIVSLVAWHPF